MNLLTPRDWAASVMQQAMQDNIEPHVAREKLAEARRYLALADEIDRLRSFEAEYLHECERLAADDIWYQLLMSRRWPLRATFKFLFTGAAEPRGAKNPSEWEFSNVEA